MKLQDICEKATSNIAQKDISDRNGIYPIYGASGFIKNIDSFAIDTPYIGIVKDGAGVGRVMLLPAKSSVIGTMQYILPKRGIDVAYLRYLLESMDLSKYSTGATIPHIYFKDYGNEQVKEYSETDQKRIADELDKVSGLIEKRQKQLEKLDLLIKSRFVEMFGDPIDENINLNKIKLGDVAILKAGKNVTSDKIHNKNEQYPYPCYGGNGIRGYVSNYSHDGCFCLIGRQGALCGNVQLAEGKFYPTEHAVVVNIKKIVNVKWLYFILTYLNLNRFQTGAAQPGLNIDILNNVEIPFHPIELQNQFADFVEKVEQNKLKIKNSLDKLITLKKALMQKYFG